MLTQLAVFYSNAARHLNVATKKLYDDANSLILSSDEIKEERNRLKRDFSRKFGLTSRQFNSVQRGLEGQHDSLKEMAKLRIGSLNGRISKTAKTIMQMEKKLTKHKAALVKIAVAQAAKKKVPASAQKALLEDPAKSRHDLHQKKRRLRNLKHKLDEAERTSQSDVPSFVFGSKKLLRQRQTIHQNDKVAMAAWQRKWQASRTSQFLIIGSKDETSGNQTCRAAVIGERLKLDLKMPGGMEGYSDREPLFVDLPEYARDVVLAAVTGANDDHRTAVAYRFVRDVDWDNHMRLSAWRVFITIKVPVEGEVTRQTLRGQTLGIDVNADHLALCLIDQYGNPTKRQRIELPLQGKTSDQRNEIIADATSKAVNIAKAFGASVAIEQLDFSRKKQEINRDNPKRKSARYARMLSSFSYAKILTEIIRKSERAGLIVRPVNPAYTSRIGAVNLSRRYGLSRHTAAAAAIARRAQDRSERVNYIFGLRSFRHTRPAPEDARRHVWKLWHGVKPEMVRHAVEKPYSTSPSDGFVGRTSCS